MAKLLAALGMSGLSKSQASTVAAELDVQVEAFRARPLDNGPYTFVAADALTMKVREGGRVVKVAAIGATLAGTPWQGGRIHFAANLQSITPKHAPGWVNAMLHSIYDQPDPKAVHAQFDRVLDAVAKARLGVITGDT